MSRPFPRNVACLRYLLQPSLSLSTKHSNNSTKRRLQSILYQQTEDGMSRFHVFCVMLTIPRYCPNTKCLKWIPPTKLHRSRMTAQKCPHCQAKICGMCRGAAHARHVDCPQDFGLEATISIAESEGWRRCYSCRTMVEVSSTKAPFLPL